MRGLTQRCPSIRPLILGRGGQRPEQRASPSVPCPRPGHHPHPGATSLEAPTPSAGRPSCCSPTVAQCMAGANTVAGSTEGASVGTSGVAGAPRSPMAQPPTSSQCWQPKKHSFHRWPASLYLAPRSTLFLAHPKLNISSSSRCYPRYVGEGGGKEKKGKTGGKYGEGKKKTNPNK